jgi:hypothetical protein
MIAEAPIRAVGPQSPPSPPYSRPAAPARPGSCAARVVKVDEKELATSKGVVLTAGMAVTVGTLTAQSVNPSYVVCSTRSLVSHRIFLRVGVQEIRRTPNRRRKVLLCAPA